MSRFSATAAIAVLLASLGAFAPRAGAAPAVTAKLDAGKGQLSMKGALDFDVAGGPVQGSVAITNIPYPPDVPLKLADGRGVGGKLSATLTFTGTYTGGARGTQSGKVVLEGTFTRADNGDSGKVHGEGEWSARADAILGRLNADCYWPSLEYEGAGVAPTAEMAFTLPPLRFEPLSTYGPPPELPSAAAASTPPDGGPARGSGSVWWAILGCIGMMLLVAIGVVVVRRFGQPRSSDSPPADRPR